MPGLKQAGRIANDQLKAHLAKFGFAPVPRTRRFLDTKLLIPQLWYSFWYRWTRKILTSNLQQGNYFFNSFVQSHIFYHPVHFESFTHNKGLTYFFFVIKTSRSLLYRYCIITLFDNLIFFYQYILVLTISTPVSS